MTQESLTEKLSSHLTRSVDDATRLRARLHLLDWAGCVAGARGTENGKRLIKQLKQPAAYLGNVLEMDDVHRSAILHPGPVVWPSAFLYAHDMDGLLDAAVRGYEAMITVGATFDAHHYAHYHPTATAGPFGAAAACWSAFIGDDGQSARCDTLVHALGLAGTLTGGLWQTRHEGDDAKQFHIARASANGASAFEAADNGLRGPRFVLEGEQGLYAATCETPKPMQLLNQWRIHDVSFKPWGACRHAHPAIDAALELKRRLGGLDGPIDIESYRDAIRFCDLAAPETVHQAKFSIQHAVAVVADKGEPELTDFEPDAIARLKDQRGRVSLAEASDITARFPQHYGARVSCGGQSVELVDALGDPERSVSDEQIIAKMRELTAWGGLDVTEADRAAELILYGDDHEQIKAMLEHWW